MVTSGIGALLELLASAGVDTIFGNPGTTELPLSDALATDARFRYVLGLQEIPVVAMADGYAMAGRRLGVVNVHISCGLGNAMGMLYNAYREGTPLLLTAGQQDRRLAASGPILAGDMVGVARPWTKWAAQVDRLADLPAVVRRAIVLAQTPPTGPVFLTLPLDLQRESAELDLAPAPKLDLAQRPAAAAIEQAVDVLLAARRPAILAGSRVLERDAVAHLVAVAERLGAAVLIEPPHSLGRLGFPADHPQFAGALPLWSPEIHARLVEFDALLAVGVDLLRLYVYYEPACPIPAHVRLVHLDDDPHEIGKNYPIAAGVVGHIRAALVDLDAALARQQTADDAAAAHARRSEWGARSTLARQELDARILAERSRRPMSGAVLMQSLARVLPPDAAVVEEAVTTTNTLLLRLGALRTTSGYFGHRGWALGWGLGCAIGVKLAWPQRPVLAVLGDGAALYGVQGLWTAAHYRLPVTFVVANNAQYQILKAGAQALGLPAAQAGRFVGMDLTDPEIDLVGLARSLGVEAQRVEDPDELSHVVARSLSANHPRLIDVPIERTLAGPG